MDTMTYNQHDTLSSLDKKSTVREKIDVIYTAVNLQFPFINRVAIALLDKKTDALRTFVFAGVDSPLINYESPLSQSPSLQRIIDAEKPRVVNDISEVYGDENLHSQKLKEAGFVSSYTMPIFHNGILFGFVFFNSMDAGQFDQKNLKTLDIFAHLISTVVTSEMVSSQILMAAIKSANDMVHYRDPETKEHLERMAHLSRMIALKLSQDGHRSFSDEEIDTIFRFAPLHDVGKVAIPDNILLKPGKLTDEEFEVMKTHATKGREIIDRMIGNFGLDSIINIDILRNIAELHHESLDGTGYPLGLEGEDVPNEARITAVADVFDALTSARPYKEAWSNKKAFAYLRKLARTRFDHDCVEALVNNPDEVVKIQERFRDNGSGSY